MTSRSVCFLALLCVVLNPDPTSAKECVNADVWQLSSESDLSPLGCADDPDWRRRWVATAGCAWVGEKPGSRCDDKDENGIKAEDACGCACGPTAAPSVEPVVYDCAWVASDAAARCGSVSELKAEDACLKTCGDGTEDSGTWFHKEQKKNCAWVGGTPDKVEKRCDKMGEDPALAACTLTCDAACAQTAAPTTLGLDAFGDDEGASDDDEVLCEDDADWSSKKGDCTWVANNPDSRCSKAGYDVKGKDACLETCGDDGVDSDTWFFRKANKNCAWIGKQNTKKQKKLCKKAGTDGNACPATCGECPTPLPTPTPVPLPTPTPSAASPVACGTYNLDNAVDAYLDDADAAEATYGGPIGEWDVSCVTDMYKMFYFAEEFNAAIDAWDVSSVTDMEWMFYFAEEFNAAIDAWDVSSVTTMAYMFAYAFAFNGAIDAWDVSSVTYMSQMFNGAAAFNAAIDAWDVSSVTSMYGMFFQAYEFDQNLGWCVGASVNTDYAFQDSVCSATSCGVTQGCCDGSGGGDSDGGDAPACGTYNLGDAVDTYLLNADCAEATYGGPIGEWDVSCVTDMLQMFKNAYAFNAAIDAWDVSSVTDMYGMFHQAYDFNGAIDAWDVSSVRSMYSMFYEADAFNGAIDAWDVSSVTNMYFMLYNAEAFNGAIDAWDVLSVTSMYAMFYGASEFDQDLGWCVGTSVNTNYAFGATACAATSCGVTQSSSC